MTDLDLVIRARRVITPGGEHPAAVAVRAGRVVAVEPFESDLGAIRVVTLDEDEVLLPGLVDTHVHVNEPGRTEWEGFETVTRAAAAGGVTTLLDMPLNSIPPTVDLDALEVKRKVADGQCHVDVGFWGGAVPSSLGRLELLHDAGVFGFKCFLIHSGVDEFPSLDTTQIEAAMREIAGFGGLLIVHAEDAATVESAPAPGGPAYEGFLRSRPPEAENRAIETLLRLAASTGCRVHVLHLSSAAALPMLASARAGGARVSVETCPHYLCLTAEEIPDGATQFKCCPPVRESGNRDQLWEGLRAGVIDLIVSDHSPSTPDLKNLDTGDFGTAWGGISSLQLGLAAIWTEARTRGFELADVVGWMSTAPARQAGLTGKGAIEAGRDADFCVLAPDETFVVDPALLHHRNPLTPYAGRRLSGVVRSSWLRGEQIDIEAAARGRLLTRGES